MRAVADAGAVVGVGAIAGTTAVVGTTASLEVVGGAFVGATAAAQAARSSLAGAGGATAGGTSAAAGAGAVSSTDRTLGSAVSSTLGSAVSSTRRRGADSLGCYVRAVSVEIWALLHSSLGSVKHVNPPMPQKPQGAGNPYRNCGYGARPTRAPGREEAESRDARDRPKPTRPDPRSPPTSLGPAAGR